MVKNEERTEVTLKKRPGGKVLLNTRRGAFKVEAEVDDKGRSVGLRDTNRRSVCPRQQDLAGIRFDGCLVVCTS